jgi:DNA adenine methylase
MRYVGGKVRIASWVEEHLQPLVERNSRYLEPFVGGGAVLARMAPKFDDIVAADAHEDLVLMWREAAAGWVPPERVSRDEYAVLRHAEPSALRGFVGYGASFSGKWFGGHVDQAWDAHHGRMTKPYAQAASRAIAKDAERYGAVNFVHADYQIWSPGPGTLVYADPPYAETLGYAAVGAFNSARFWEIAECWAIGGADVVVSESVAPPGWRVLVERQRRAMLRATKGGSQADRAERLFVFDPEWDASEGVVA